VAEKLLTEHPDAIIVETGLPLWRPEQARSYVATNGAGRVNLQAAAERLRGN
jgi:beta-N-acetylhexosaminidase